MQASDAKFDAAQDAGVELARLMERQLGFNEGRLSSVTVGLFVQAYGDRLQAYISTILDGRD